jgi:hypothetical protein
LNLRVALRPSCPLPRPLDPVIDFFDAGRHGSFTVEMAGLAKRPGPGKDDPSPTPRLDLSHVVLNCPM